MESLTAFSTLAMVILTAVYVVLTHRILRAQSDPCVIVYVDHQPAGHGVLRIVIENVGRGLARDVRFELPEPLPAGLLGHPFPDKLMDRGPLITGIPALPPGGKRIIMWGNYGELERLLGDKTPVVVCKCRRGDALVIENDVEPIECVLDYRSFEGTSQYVTTAERIVDKLDAIGRKIDVLNGRDPVSRVLRGVQTPPSHEG